MQPLIRSLSLFPLAACAVLSFLSSFPLRAQEDYVIPELEEEALLRLLFDVKQYSVDRGGAWLPDFEEGMNFNVSDDGYCYTNLDTAMLVPLETGEDDQDVSLALLVFTTYGYSGDERSDCHACAPDISLALYEEVENGWSLRAFRKHVTQLGTFGVRGDLSVVEVGEGLYALNMESGFTGQGYTIGSSTLISMAPYNDLEEIFTATTYDVGPDGCEEECGQEWCENYRNIEKELEFLPNIYTDAEYPEFNNLVVTVTERTCQGKEHAYTERYLFNGVRYERVCE